MWNIQVFDSKPTEQYLKGMNSWSKFHVQKKVNWHPNFRDHDMTSSVRDHNMASSASPRDPWETLWDVWCKITRQHLRFSYFLYGIAVLESFWKFLGNAYDRVFYRKNRFKYYHCYTSRKFSDFLEQLFFIAPFRNSHCIYVQIDDSFKSLGWCFIRKGIFMNTILSFFRVVASIFFRYQHLSFFHVKIGFWKLDNGSLFSSFWKGVSTEYALRMFTLSNLPVSDIDYPILGVEIQETFLAPPADKQTHNYDTDCSNHHPSLSTLRSKGLSCCKMKCWPIYTNLPVNTIARLPHSQSRDSQGQETF